MHEARTDQGVSIDGRATFAPWSDPAARPLVRFDNVGKRFGDVVAVDDVSLDIHAGEVLCLLGPSGCGKTTLMRMLAGFEAPTSGRVTLDGVDLAGEPPHRRPINMMFQSYALFPHLTVADNIAFGLRQAGLPRAEIEARVRELVALVQLGGLEGRRPAALSGGQKQRVALARALARRPKVLLLDEPLAALDKRIREETQFELMRIRRELGATFLIVTHDQDEAMTLADRIAVMEAGRIAQVGTPREIYETPATVSVARFIGDINLVEAVATAVHADRTVSLASPLARGALLASARGAPPAEGQALTLAFRPENVRVQAGAAAAGANAFPGELQDIAYRGDNALLVVRAAGGQTLRASARGADAARWLDVGKGAPVVLSVDPAHAWVMSE